jgi:hypothetical protein
MLQLALTKSAVRYCIQSMAHNQVIFFAEYLLHHVESDRDLLRRLDKIYQTDEVLQLAFGKVVVGLDTEYTLVPEGLNFDASNAESISLKNKIPALGLDFQFTIDFGLNYKLKSLYPDCSMQHLAASFLLIAQHMHNPESDQLFINVPGNYFDLVRFKADGQLQLMNRYQYKADTDLLYFLVLAFEKLGLDRENTAVVISGNMEELSPPYNLIYKYFRNVQFLPTGDELQFSKAFDEVSKHEHINLYKLGTL